MGGSLMARFRHGLGALAALANGLAYRETIDWLYSHDPTPLRIYAEFVGISVDMAKRVRDDFFPRSSVDPDKIVGIDAIAKDAVELKYTAVALNKEQLAELIQILPRR
jgi:NitT/TauT family transport system substrate-binding protein